ncbi:MAG: hypothetical protein ACYSUN_01570, partial [Planctomycetota bacterium]
MMRDTLLARHCVVLLLALALTACGDSSLISDTDGQTLRTRTITGTIVEGSISLQVLASPGSGLLIVLDDGLLETRCDDEGRFEMAPVPNGDHSLFVHASDGHVVEIPCRILDGRGIAMGTLTINEGEMLGHTGFDGYQCAFVDEDGDGVNDL